MRHSYSYMFLTRSRWSFLARSTAIYQRDRFRVIIFTQLDFLAILNEPRKQIFLSPRPFIGSHDRDRGRIRTDASRKQRSRASRTSGDLSRERVGGRARGWERIDSCVHHGLSTESLVAVQFRSSGTVLQLATSGDYTDLLSLDGEKKRSVAVKIV